MRPSLSEDELHRRFWDRGDRRQLFARDLRDPSGELRFMAPGAAETLRPLARSGHLICPVAGCPSPAFTTRGGSRRHHFVHLNGRGTDHDGESFVHHAGKQLVAHWIRSTYPAAYLKIDTEKVDNGQLPDVLVVMPDGARYAIEVQYSGLSVEEWQLRHQGYVDQGIHDIWFLGHLPPNLRVSARERDRGGLQIGALHQAIHAAGLPLVWMNPFAEVMAVATFRLWDHDLLINSTAATFYGGIGLALDPLTSCRLEDGRLRSPGLDAALGQLELERAEERRRTEERLEDCRRMEAARQRRLKAEEDRRRRAAQYSDEDRRRWKEQLHIRLGIEWERYERDAVLLRLGRVPWFITEPLDSDRYVWGRTGVHWRARIFLDHIHGAVGKTLTFNTVSRDFAASHTSARRIPWEFIGDYLARLRTAGFLEFETDPSGFIRSEIRVLADDLNATRPAVALCSSHAHRLLGPSLNDNDEAGDPRRFSAEAKIDAAQPSAQAGSSQREAPSPADADSLPIWLQELVGIPGRKRWQELQVLYVRRVRSVPPVLSMPTPYDQVLGVHPPLWKHYVAERLLNGRIGHRAGLASALRCLGFRYSDTPASIRTAVMEFLQQLAEDGYLHGPHGGGVLQGLMTPAKQFDTRPDGDAGPSR